MCSDVLAGVNHSTYFDRFEFLSAQCCGEGTNGLCQVHHTYQHDRRVGLKIPICVGGSGSNDTDCALTVPREVILGLSASSSNPALLVYFSVELILYV